MFTNGLQLLEYEQAEAKLLSFDDSDRWILFCERLTPIRDNVAIEAFM